MTRRRIAATAVLAIALALPSAAIQDTLAQVPNSVAGDLRRELMANRARVEKTIDDFNTRATDYNRRCQGLAATHPNAAACQRELAALSQEATNIERDKTVFNASVASASAATVNSDSRVVDTRGLEVAGSELVAQVPHLRGSAGATAMAKGFQALINRDWQLTLAWWQTAQLRDPMNPAIAAGVDLAKWTIEYHRQQGRQTTLDQKRKSREVPPPPGWYLDTARQMETGLVREAIRMLEAAVERAEAWLQRKTP